MAKITSALVGSLLLGTSLHVAVAADGAKGAAPAPPAPVAQVRIDKTQATPKRATPLERRLFSDTFEASTFLWNDWNKFQENYHANYAGDDDPKTAWVEGDKSSGAGQWLRMKLTPLDATTAVRIRIRNGYQKSPELFKQNARVKTATITLMPSGVQKTVELKDDAAWQEFVLPQTAGVLQAVELKVASVYEGSKYTDMCLSDMQVFATSTSVDNPAFEKSKKQKLTAWRAARVAAAKEFAKGKVGSVLVPAYDVTKTQLDNGNSVGLEVTMAKPAIKEWLPAFEVAKQAVAQFKTPATTGMILMPAQLFRPAGAKMPPTDGFATPSLESAYYGGSDEVAMLPIVANTSIFFADRSKIAEMKSKLTVDEAFAAPKCKGQKYWVMRTHDPEGKAPDRVAALVVTDCGMVETRGGKDLATMAQVLVYRDDGKLALVAGARSDGEFEYVTGYRWGDRSGAPTILAAANATAWSIATVAAKEGISAK